MAAFFNRELAPEPCRSTDGALHDVIPPTRPRFAHKQRLDSMYAPLSFGRVAGCAADRALASRA